MKTDSDIVIVRRLKWLIEGYDLGYFEKDEVMTRGKEMIEHQEWADGL